MHKYQTEVTGALGVATYAKTQQEHAAPKVPAQPQSVDQRADMILQSAATIHSQAYALLKGVRNGGLSEPAEDSQVPCRSGIDGKLTDGLDHMEVTYKILEELRAYLIG